MNNIPKKTSLVSNTSTVCTKCACENIIIRQKQSGQALCKDCFIESIEKKVIKTIKKEKLINKGDKILLALSGGKDSVATLEILSSFYKRNIIDLIAVTINEGIGNYREEGVEIAKAHCQSLGIEHKIVSFKDIYGTTLDKIMENPERISCSYCGVFRRNIINKIAREIGATKIATGHNLNDECQAILMNYLEGNIENLRRIGPKTEAKSELFTPKIKPLREIPEREIGLYVVAKDLGVHFNGCPYSQQSFRREIGEFIEGISKNHPTMMYSTLKGFDKIKSALKIEQTIEQATEDELESKKDTINSKTAKFSTCNRCGEPSFNELCRACIFLEELNIN